MTSLPNDALEPALPASSHGTSATPAGLRIARPSDRAAVRAFLGRLSASTIQARYLSPWTSLVGQLADRETHRLLDGDQLRHVVLLAVDGADIRGVGEFFADDSGPEAELAMVVEDAFQHRGIGQRIFRQLERLARSRGISAFTGDVGYGNQRIQRFLRKTGRPLVTQLDFGVVRFTLQLESNAA